MPLRFVTVDLRKAKIQAARFTADGLQEARVVLSTNVQDGLDVGVRRICSAIRQVWPMQEMVSAIGVSVPGMLDTKRGVLHTSAELPGWYDVAFRDTLVEVFGVPVFVGPAAGAAALAEQRFGVGQGVADLVYIAMGETLESGIVLDNRLFTGGNGLGGGIGRIAMLLPEDTVQGAVTYLESLLGNAALLQRVHDRIVRGEASLLPEMVGGDLSRLTIEAMCAAAQQNDRPALAVLSEAGTYLGMAIVSLMHLLNPSLFVLDGTVKLAGNAILGALHQSILTHAPDVYQEHTRTVLAQFGDDIGVWGALALCLVELGL